MILNRKHLFSMGDGGVFGFRIPSVITLRSGKVLVFCEARNSDIGDSGSIDIVMRSGDGENFAPMRTIVSGGKNTAGNPSPLQDPATGRLFLMYNANDADKPEGMILRGEGPRTVHIIYSDDEGESWSKPKDITADVKLPDWTWYAVGPCHGAVLPDGRLIYGCNHAVLDRETRKSGPYMSHTVYSDDHGETWHIGGILGEGTNECSVAAFPDGGLLINMRFIPYGGMENPHCRAQAWSNDGGISFTETVFFPELTDPVCQGNILNVKTENGETLLFSNADSCERRNMTVRRSDDKGRTWRTEAVVEEGHAAYSDMTQLPDGRIGILFETGRDNPYQNIDWAVMTLEG